MFDENEKDKPTEKGVRVIPKKAVQVFKNKINFSLRKDTFDASHMDKIISSPFCLTKTSIPYASIKTK